MVLKKPVLWSMCLFLLLLSACGPAISGQESQVNGVRSWFDAPQPNTVYVPPNPCQIVAHGASPAGINSFEITINGESVTIPSPDSQSTLVTLTRDCGLYEPGKYLLLMRVQDNAGIWSGYAETSLVISRPEPATATPQPIEPSSPEPSVTEPVAPTPTSTPEPKASISFEQVSTNLVYIGRSSCGPTDVTISARASAPKEIKVVVLFYRFQTGSATTAFESLAMNPIGGDLYRVVLNPSSLLGGAIPFDQATLQYQAVIQQVDGDTSVRTALMTDILVNACGRVTSACSSYTDERSCIANGCQWVTLPGSVPIYECRSP